MSLTAGLRNVGGGEADYMIYKNHYNQIVTNVYVDYFEPGYSIAVTLGRFFGLSYNLFVLILTSISIALLIRLFEKRSRFPHLSVFLYLSTYYLFYNMVLLRQMVAVIAFLYCVFAIIEERPLRFLSWAVVGIMFHFSMLIVIPLYFILKFVKPNVIFLGVLLLLSIYARAIGIEGLASLVGGVSSGLAGRLLAYVATQEEFSLNILEYIKLAIVWSLIFFNRKKICDNIVLKKYVLLYLLFSCLIIAFGKVEVLFRVAMYFDLIILFLIPELITFIKTDLSYKFLLCTVIGLFSVFSFMYRASKFNEGEFYKYKPYFLENT